MRIFDISNPAGPRLVRDLQCDGLQADPIVWDRNGNGVADLLLVAVDRTMDSPACGAPRSADHANPTGWVDESFGSGCPTMTQWAVRPWHPAALQKTGKMFFSDMEGNFLSEFHVGENNAIAQGMVVYRAIMQKPGKPKRVDHLNPQTME